MKWKRKNAKPDSEISTASMPDIVFLLLFFFMVSATIRPKENNLNVSIPDAHAVTKVKKKFLVKELHIGFPMGEGKNGITKISDGDRIIEVTDIGRWVEEQKLTLNEAYRDQMIVLIRADEEVEMGIIGDIMTELRRSNARKVLYRTLENVGNA